MAEKIMGEPQHATSFKQSLGLLDGTMIVAGSMIGSGIFIVSADITRNVGRCRLVDRCLVDHGIYDDYCCCELWRVEWNVSKAGGQYVYLKEAYNPFL